MVRPPTMSLKRPIPNKNKKKEKNKKKSKIIFTVAMKISK